MDLDPDGGRLAVDAERELLVPLRVGLPGLVGPGLQFRARIDPRDGEGFHGLGDSG